jgi:hypothetical protein
MIISKQNRRVIYENLFKGVCATLLCSRCP